jgi:hypothetical protein
LSRAREAPVAWRPTRDKAAPPVHREKLVRVSEATSSLGTIGLGYLISLIFKSARKNEWEMFRRWHVD